MKKLYKIIIVIALVFLSSPSSALDELGTDPRIRSIIYGKNDVFKINSVYGFQTLVEFDQNETIMTISMGNPNIFKIIPSGNKLYIKALINSQITNMTVVTDMRSYQLELTSQPESPEDMTYLVRFVYPEYLDGETTGPAKPKTEKPMSLTSSRGFIPVNLSMPKIGGVNMPNLPNSSVSVGTDKSRKNLLDIPSLNVKTDY